MSVMKSILALGLGACAYVTYKTMFPPNTEGIDPAATKKNYT